MIIYIRDAKHLALATLIFCSFQLQVIPAVSPADPELPSVVDRKATPFPLTDVRLRPGPFQEAQERNNRYLLSVEPDRLLAGFLSEAGLPPKGKRYGGWESREIHGHGLGHYLSAVSIAYAATGDARFLDRVNYIVSELALCQQANTNGYVAPMPQLIYRELQTGQIKAQAFSLNNYWVPNYTLHKIFAGLHDAYRCASNQLALQIEIKLANWLNDILCGLTPAQIQKILRTEHGGLLESFADLAAATGDRRYLDMAKKYFHHDDVFAPLFKGEDRLNGLHANTQIPKIVGLAREYELTGANENRVATTTFWNNVVSNRSYVTGGHGEREHFFTPASFPQKLTDQTSETCNSYNLFRLARHLFAWQPEAAQMDFVERALINHVFANLGRAPGEFGYFLSSSPVAVKVFSTPENAWWCCVGIGMENPPRYGELIYFHQADTLWVNLFLASELNWRENGVTLRQETHFPEEETVRFTVTCTKPTKFMLKLRKPCWCAKPIVKINGQTHKSDSAPDSYLTYDRTWQSGDTLELTLPMTLRLESLPNSQDKIIAALYGPTVLAGIVAAEPSTTDPAKKRYDDHLQAKFKPADLPPILVVTNGNDFLAHLKPFGTNFAEFRSTDVLKPADLSFVPLYRIYEEHYAVYFPLLMPTEWQQREAALRAAEAARIAAEAATVDLITPGFQQNEVDHGFKSDNSYCGDLGERKWRDARDGGWFSYELKVESDKPQFLVCTYWGSETGPRTFDILVDDLKLATQSLGNNRPNQFWDTTYPIPADVTRNKNKITVKFQARPSNYAGGIFGVRTIRKPNANR